MSSSELSASTGVEKSEIVRPRDSNSTLQDRSGVTASRRAARMGAYYTNRGISVAAHKGVNRPFPQTSPSWTSTPIGALGAAAGPAMIGFLWQWIEHRRTIRRSWQEDARRLTAVALQGA